MTDRAHAVAILRQAREILARRLTERIVELEEELLDDARGDTYLGEIETVYEQVALRLSHVNSMLNHLPAEEDAAAMDIAPSGAGNSSYPRARTAVIVSEAFQADTASLAGATLTAPHEVTALPTVVTFEMFARQILCDDLEWAGRSLAVLFGVDEDLGRRCAREFQIRLDQAPETMARLVQLRRELQDGGIHSPLRMLGECFGLEGLEAISVLQTLRARLIGHNEAA